MAWNKVLTPEGCVKSVVKQYLRMNGWYLVHIQQGALSHRGISDLIGVKCGVVVFIEIKAPERQDKRGRWLPQSEQSQHQKDFKEAVEAKGGNYFVLRSIEDAEAMERKLDLRVPSSKFGVRS